MLEDASGKLKVLVGAVGVNLALAVSVGAVPQLGDDTVRTAAVAEAVQELAAPTRQPGDTARLAPREPAPTVPPATTPPAPPATVPKPKATATTRAPKAPATPKVQPATIAAPPPVPTGPVKVARRTPASVLPARRAASLPVLEAITQDA